MLDDPTIPHDPERATELEPTALGDPARRNAASVKPPACDEPEELQRHLPQYRVRELVGRGGMGNVLKVDDPKLARTVALKTMKLGTDATEEQRGRFVREATVLAKLAHPNIVPIYDLGADDEGSPFYTMKLVKGRTLQAIIKDLRDGVPEAAKQHSLDRLLGVFRKVCDAIAFAHSKGVLHRDLKPENIMVGEFGEVLVMDWGLAKFLDGGQEASSGPALSQSLVEHSRASIGPFTLQGTLDGSVMGTPQYMSPEQAEGKTAELGERSDIFSLGAILYAILTLHPPVEGKSVQEVLRKISAGQIAPPSAFGAKSESQGAAITKGEVLDARVFRPLPHCPGGRVPPALSAVTMKALSVDQARRYQSVNEFAAEVEAWQSGFATGAENAGFGRQIVLLVKRHKGVFSTAAAAWLIITALAVWFVVGIRARERRAVQGELAARIERNRAETEKIHAENETVRANTALADLKKTAPALFQLAESEAGFQHFDSALQKLDAALALDPSLLPGWWRRAWLLLGMERWSDAADAIRVAQQRDPANASLAAILPVVSQLANANGDTDHWTPDRAVALTRHLQRVGAPGELSALSARLQLNARDKAKLVRQRLDEWLGKGKGKVAVTDNGLIEVSNFPPEIEALDPLQGLPIDRLDLGSMRFRDLKPLAGMRLRYLNMSVGGLDTAVSLEPLRGMPLAEIHMNGRKVADLSPLQRMPLEVFEAHGCRIVDLSPLRGAPLRKLSLLTNGVSELRPLADSPIEWLHLGENPVTDLSPLRGKPLRYLELGRSRITDFSPLRGMPLEELRVGVNFQPLDLAPLLDLPHLEKLRVDRMHKNLALLRQHPTLRFLAYNGEGYKPVAEFWTEYDAQHAAGKK